MKKTVIMILAALLIVTMVIGCTPKYVEPAPEPKQEVEVASEPEPEPKQEAEVASEPEPEPKQETEDDGLDYNFESLPSDEQRKIKMIRNLLKEARAKEANYFFRLTGPKIPQTDVWVKGDIMKRQVYRPAELDKFTTFNMVYMNLKTLKAEGYCETSKAKCWEGHGPFDASTARWKVKTPKDWVMELDDNFRWTLDNKIGDQLYHIIDYVQPTKTIRVYVNDYQGWPYRVEIYPAGTTIDSIMTNRATEEYMYDDMDIGGVSDDDVTPG